MNEFITLQQVKELWALPGKPLPSTATIWRRRRMGLIPAPKLVGRDNLFRRDEVIRLRDEYLNT
ncbi:hypothetical protein [Neisseria dentiae]|uniref:hypothetical protein n=1 Tax=Neisseria dentiae TaxID=194197 RepID=UPI0035A0AF37